MPSNRYLLAGVIAMCAMLLPAAAGAGGIAGSIAAAEAGAIARSGSIAGSEAQSDLAVRQSSRAYGGALGQAPTAVGSCAGGVRILFGAAEWTQTLPGACLGAMVAAIAPMLDGEDDVARQLRWAVLRIIQRFETQYFGADDFSGHDSNP